MKKNMIRTLAAIFILTCMFAMTASAAAQIKKVKYEGNGKVDVDFSSKVKYKNVKVTVKDAKGVKVSTVIVDKDKDDLEFRMTGFKQGKTYTFTISGIKKRGEKAFGSVKGTVKVPKASKAKGSIKIKEIDYDHEDMDVDIEFSVKVQWKNPKVTITDGKNQYVVRITDKDHDDMEIKVTKLTPGKTYTYKISGIRRKGETAYTTISGTFVA